MQLKAEELNSLNLLAGADGARTHDNRYHNRGVIPFWIMA